MALIKDIVLYSGSLMVKPLKQRLVSNIVEGLLWFAQCPLLSCIDRSLSGVDDRRLGVRCTLRISIVSRRIGASTSP